MRLKGRSRRAQLSLVAVTSSWRTSGYWMPLRPSFAALRDELNVPAALGASFSHREIRGSKDAGAAEFDQVLWALEAEAGRPRGSPGKTSPRPSPPSPQSAWAAEAGQGLQGGRCPARPTRRCRLVHRSTGKDSYTNSNHSGKMTMTVPRSKNSRQNCVLAIPSWPPCSPADLSRRQARHRPPHGHRLLLRHRPRP